MLKRALVVSLLGAVFAADASAGTITHSGLGGLWYDGFLPWGISEEYHTLTVPRWDPAAYPGQTLANASITFQASFHFFERVGITAITGDKDIYYGDVPFTYDSFANTSLMLPDGTPLVSLALQSSTSTVRQSVTYVLEQDWRMDQAVEVDLSGSQTAEFTGDLSAFFGAGDLVMPVNHEVGVTIPPQNFDRGGVRDNGIGTLLGGMASASVTYTWVPVPEPPSLVLAALGLIGLAAWGWRRTR